MLALDAFKSLVESVYFGVVWTGNYGIAFETLPWLPNAVRLPQSLPSIANMSIYGRAEENGVLLRRGTGLNLWNSFIDGSKSGIEMSAVCNATTTWAAMTIGSTV